MGIDGNIPLFKSTAFKILCEEKKDTSLMPHAHETSLQICHQHHDSSKENSLIIRMLLNLNFSFGSKYQEYFLQVNCQEVRNSAFSLGNYKFLTNF